MSLDLTTGGQTRGHSGGGHTNEVKCQSFDSDRAGHCLFF